MKRPIHSLGSPPVSPLLRSLLVISEVEQNLGVIDAVTSTVDRHLQRLQQPDAWRPPPQLFDTDRSELPGVRSPRQW